MAIGLAFRAFFKVLFSQDAAKRVRAALAGKPPEAPATASADKLAAKKTKPTAAASQASAGVTRSDALTLLSTLQRESRLLDLVGEPLDQFDDAQVGAAARQVIGDLRKALDRMFEIVPLEATEEGVTVAIPSPAQPARYHLIGRGTEQATRGTIVHRGWKAQRCQTPSWNGAGEDALVLSPVEIEVDG